MTLDTDRAQNIVADGATMANVGSNKQLSYIWLLDTSGAAAGTQHEADGGQQLGQRHDHFTYPRLLRFVLPAVGTMLFTSIYGIVDGLCVSNLDVYKRQRMMFCITGPR